MTRPAHAAPPVRASILTLWHAMRWQLLGAVPLTIAIAVAMNVVTISFNDIQVTVASVVGFTVVCLAIGFASSAAPLLQLCVAQGISRRATLAAGAILFTALAVAGAAATGLVARWELGRTTAATGSNDFGTFVSSSSDPLVVGLHTVVVALVVTLVVWLMALVWRHFGATWSVVVTIAATTLTGMALAHTFANDSLTGPVAVVATVALVGVLASIVTNLALRAPVSIASPWINSGVG